MNATLIRKELLKHGASRKQADFYIGLIKDFAAQSEGSGEKHHILPVNCGWWRKYKTAQWNLAVIDLGLHAALHGYLYFMFPTNKSLHEAIRAVYITRRGAYKKNLQDKQKLIDWYLAGRSTSWISRQHLPGKPGPLSVHNWLKEWGVKFRSNGESNAHPAKEKYKDRIIAWYHEGRTAAWITKRIGLRGSANSVLSWLVTWGIHTRGTAEARRRSYAFKHRRHFQQALVLYDRGLSFEAIARELKIDPKTIRDFVVQTGRKIRPHSEYARSPKRKQYQTRILQWDRAGVNHTEIARRVGISRGRIIRRWLGDYGRRSKLPQNRNKSELTKDLQTSE